MATIFRGIYSRKFEDLARSPLLSHSRLKVFQPWMYFKRNKTSRTQTALSNSTTACTKMRHSQAPANQSFSAFYLTSSLKKQVVLILQALCKYIFQNTFLVPNSMFPRQTPSRPSFSSTRHWGAWWGRKSVWHPNAVEMRLPEGQRSSEWVVWLPAVVSSLNGEVTRSRAKTRWGHQRKGRLFQALHPSTQIFSPARDMTPFRGGCVLSLPARRAWGRKQKSHRSDLAFKVYHIVKTITKPDELILDYLHHGPKRGFVCEELLVVPTDTELPPLHRWYSIGSVWMPSWQDPSFVVVGVQRQCFLMISAHRHFVHSHSSVRGWRCLRPPPARLWTAPSAFCFGALSSPTRTLSPFFSLPPWNNTCWTARFRKCPWTPAWKVPALARSVLFCGLGTFPPWRGKPPLPGNLTTARGRGYRCLSGSARNWACRGTFPVILESLSSGRSWGHGHQEGCARSGSSTAFVARKAKIEQWMVFGILNAIRMSSLIAFRISERSLSLKRTFTFSLPHFHMHISSFTFIRQAWNAVVYYLIV